MPCFLCTTCGTQYPDSDRPPESCVICAEERQYIGWQGQRWTTVPELQAAHQARIEPEGPGLTGVGSRPDFAIAQRALHLTTATGGILWDCAALLDETVVEALGKRGGVRAMAISHPHFYSTMVEWSRAAAESAAVGTDSVVSAVAAESTGAAAVLDPVPDAAQAASRGSRPMAAARIRIAGMMRLELKEGVATLP